MEVLEPDQYWISEADTDIDILKFLKKSDNDKLADDKCIKYK